MKLKQVIILIALVLALAAAARWAEGLWIGPTGIQARPLLPWDR